MESGGTKVSFVQSDDAGEKGELWYVDAATGEKKVLVSEVKLAALAPDVNKIKNEREKERLTRYHVAAYRGLRIPSIAFRFAWAALAL